MSNIVRLDPIAHARAVKARLWNPPNGRKSSELEITNEQQQRQRKATERQGEAAMRAEWEAQRAEQIKKQEAADRRAEEDFKRELAIDTAIRKALESHANTKKIAETIIADEDIHPPKLRRIIDLVCKTFSVPRASLSGERRDMRACIPRHVAMYLAHTLTFKSLPQIAREFGGRDHTTILNGARRTKQRMEKNAEFREIVERLRAELAA